MRGERGVCVMCARRCPQARSHTLNKATPRICLRNIARSQGKQFGTRCFAGTWVAALGPTNTARQAVLTKPCDVLINGVARSLGPCLTIVDGLVRGRGSNASPCRVAPTNSAANSCAKPPCQHSAKAWPTVLQAVFGDNMGVKRRDSKSRLYGLLSVSPSRQRRARPDATMVLSVSCGNSSRQV